MTLLPHNVKLSSLEIGLHLFLPTYSTMIMIDRSGTLMALEADVSQTGGNVDYFCICALPARSPFQEP